MKIGCARTRTSTDNQTIEPLNEAYIRLNRRQRGVLDDVNQNR